MSLKFPPSPPGRASLKILRMAVSVTKFVHYHKGLVAMFEQRLISEQLKPTP